MKINTNNTIKSYMNDMLLHTKENSSSVRIQSREHKFDAITIQSDPRQIEQLTFAKAVSREISSKISAAPSEERIQELKERVASHSYQIDARAIASRMLLLGEESAYE